MSQWLGWLFTTTPINARSVYAQNSSTALMTTRQNCSKYMTFRSLSKSYETSLARNAKKLLIFHVFIACAHHLVRTYYEPANHSYVRSTRAPRAGLPPTDQAAGMATAAVVAANAHWLPALTWPWGVVFWIRNRDERMKGHSANKCEGITIVSFPISAASKYKQEYLAKVSPLKKILL